MRNNHSIKIGLAIGIITLFILSALTPIAFGDNIRTTKIELIDKDYTFDRFDKHYFPEWYSPDEHTTGSWSDDVDSIFVPKVTTKYDLPETNQKESLFSITSLDGPMDSPWPMYCHDTRHTGRSPYSTTENMGFEEWRFGAIGFADSSPVIDTNGIIYMGSWFLHAIYPNGTLKWKCDTPMVITSGPAIDENGILYVGSIWAWPNYLYAIYTSNGTLKWKYNAGGDDIYSSPAIGDDGTIYFSTDDGYEDSWTGSIRALNPDGTLKWRYHTNHVVYSSPAIGDDGTVYCGSHDTYLYALYPNNGTLKWKFKTGNWVHGSPTIGDDGTIYIGSDDGYLYALYPNNGSMKWQCNVGSMYCSPALDDEGILYFGVWEERFYAVYPNGVVKWSFNLGNYNGVWGSSAALSNDGTIYFGMCYDMGTGSNGDIIALNPDGTEKWRSGIGRCHSSPTIGVDGTVYICNHGDNGHLFAFGNQGSNPLTPNINGPISGKPGTPYIYKFTSIDPDGDQVSYYIDWGDGDTTDWTDFQPSGDSYSASHIWATKGTYVIRAKAKDTEGYESEWGTLTVIMPRNKATNNVLLLRFLEHYPLLQKLLLLIK